MSLRVCQAVLLVFLVAAGCHTRPAAPAPAVPPKVTVSRPVQRKIADTRDFTGRIEAVETADIRARVRGFLQKVHFKEGVEVKQGDLLYEIDPRTFQADVERAQAEAEKLEAQLRLSTSEAERATRLRGTQAVSQEEYTQRVAARDTARAALAQSKAALESARLELSFTQIRAPIAGRIGRTLVTEGNLVGFNEPTLLTSIVRTDPMYVVFEAPEQDFLDYQKRVREQGVATAADAKVPVYVGLANEEGRPHEGIINFRDNRVDPGTGTMLIRGELPNPQRVLVPGLYARIRVPVSARRLRLLVPEAALAADQRGQYVFVVQDDNTVAQRHVKTGQREGEFIILESGLKPEEWVIVNGIQRARPGAPVAPERVEPEKQIPDDQ